MQRRNVLCALNRNDSYWIHKRIMISIGPLLLLLNFRPMRTAQQRAHMLTDRDQRLTECMILLGNRRKSLNGIPFIDYQPNDVEINQLLTTLRTNGT